MKWFVLWVYMTAPFHLGIDRMSAGWFTDMTLYSYADCLNHMKEEEIDVCLEPGIMPGPVASMLFSR